MEVITFANIKGGVGKTSLAALMANYLAAGQQRVLLIDLDPQNSLTNLYIRGDANLQEYNIQQALMRGDLAGNILATHKEGIQMIGSQFELFDLRSIQEHTLQRLLAASQLDVQYDYVIIDTGGAWDNFVINAVHASDVIISPVDLSHNTVKATQLLATKLQQETQKYGQWFVLINNFSTNNSLTSLYLEQLEQTFGAEVLLKSQIKSTIALKKHLDANWSLSNKGDTKVLFQSIVQLAAEITERTFNVEGF
jgi:chromosome partitioning protein